MNLVIHDLKSADWQKIEHEYEGWTVLSDNGLIRPCVGCFHCWNKTPGICVMKDGFENMGQLIHQAGEVVVISRYAYGGFSGFVKNVIDRCLGYVLPQFEIIGGETHHQKRYEETKAFTFIFYGPALTKQEQDSARRYVRALCSNFRGYVKAVIFREDGQEHLPPVTRSACPSGRTVLLIGSMRGLNGNSGRLARKLAESLTNQHEIITIQRYIHDFDRLVRSLEDAETLVLCMPLYVDGLPSQMIRLMEHFELGYQGGASPSASAPRRRRLKAWTSWQKRSMREARSPIFLPSRTPFPARSISRSRMQTGIGRRKRTGFSLPICIGGCKDTATNMRG